MTGEATGEPRADAALGRLDELAGLPVTEHARVFEDVHRRLADILDELDAGQQDGRGAGAVPGAAAVPGAGAAAGAVPGAGAAYRPGR